MAAEDALKQRLAWLEEERRKDHSLILALQERLVSLEGDYRAVTEQIKTLESDLASTRASLGRMEQLEGGLARVEQEAAQRLEDAEQRWSNRLRDSEASQRQDIEALRERLSETYKKLDVLPQIERALAARERNLRKFAMPRRRWKPAWKAWSTPKKTAAARCTCCRNPKTGTRSGWWMCRAR